MKLDHFWAERSGRFSGHMSKSGVTISEAGGSLDKLQYGDIYSTGVDSRLSGGDE
jgi:hypothetical protein